MTTTTTITPTLAVERAALDRVTVDFYRDIHKGIRGELFGVTQAAGAADPGDREIVSAVADRITALVRLLVSHAEHEDAFIAPLVEQHAPRLADRIAREHEAIEGQMARLEILADRARDAARVERRAHAHRLYLALASFTADYLQHQAVEELEVGPALGAAIGADELAAVHHALVASIPPDEMAAALRVMIPAMNVDDRAELLGGMKAGAPAEVFAGVRALARSVLPPADFGALDARLAAA
jgi:hypothetical protein